MLHREKELRTRMRWVAVVFGLLLVVGMVALISYVQKSRPITVDMSQPKRR
jgi:hypothetical protein